MCTLQSRDVQEDSLHVVTGMLKHFHLYIYVFQDPDATLSFVTLYGAMRFDVLPDVLLEPFFVSTLVDDYVMVKRVIIKFLVSLYHRVTLVCLVELDLLNFDVILGMDLLNSCYAFIDCRNCLVNFYFRMILYKNGRGGIQCLRVSLSLVLKLQR